jgi:hypothetical protein
MVGRCNHFWVQVKVVLQICHTISAKKEYSPIRNTILFLPRGYNEWNKYGIHDHVMLPVRTSSVRYLFYLWQLCDCPYHIGCVVVIGTLVVVIEWVYNPSPSIYYNFTVNPASCSIGTLFVPIIFLFIYICLRGYTMNYFEFYFTNTLSTISWLY